MTHPVFVAVCKPTKNLFERIQSERYIDLSTWQLLLLWLFVANSVPKTRGA
jgi:hypothetical protein